MNDMEEIIVESREGFIAAVRNAAQRSFSEARNNPCVIRLADTKCHWKFPEGITVQRAEQLAKHARLTPARMFR